MHKDGNCKEVMKKIKNNWQVFSEEDIAKMQDAYEQRERKVIKKYRYQTDEFPSDN